MEAKNLAARPASLPLFERATRSTIAMLVVRRHEKGAWVRSPKNFTPDELPNREAVRQRFGGGKYEVIGRDTQRLVARTTFVLDGPTLPFEEDKKRKALAPRTGERAYGSDAGERQSLGFSLFDQGFTCVEVTQRTGIDNDTVRDIYLRWLTPDSGERPTTPEQIAHMHERRIQKLRERMCALMQQSDS